MGSASRAGPGRVGEIRGRMSSLSTIHHPHPPGESISVSNQIGHQFQIRASLLAVRSSTLLVSCPHPSPSSPPSVPPAIRRRPPYVAVSLWEGFGDRRVRGLSRGGKTSKVLHSARWEKKLGFGMCSCPPGTWFHHSVFARCSSTCVQR
jgi:hypothetical protein